MTKYTLLIVEDDAKTRKWEEPYFQRSEFEVDFAYDASHALALLKTKHYDYAVIDIMLPVISGADLVKLINKQNPKTQCILCTAILEFEVFRDCQGTIGLIEKPLYPFKVSDIIEKSIKKVAI